MTQNLKIYNIFLHHSNNGVISFQMISGFSVLSIYFNHKFLSKLPNVFFNIIKMPKSWHSKGTCHNIDIVQPKLILGFIPGATMYPGCKSRDYLPHNNKINISAPSPSTVIQSKPGVISGESGRPPGTAQTHLHAAMELFTSLFFDLCRHFLNKCFILSVDVFKSSHLCVSLGYFVLSNFESFRHFGVDVFDLAMARSYRLNLFLQKAFSVSNFLQRLLQIGLLSL